VDPPGRRVHDLHGPDAPGHGRRQRELLRSRSQPWPRAPCFTVVDRLASAPTFLAVTGGLRRCGERGPGEQLLGGPGGGINQGVPGELQRRGGADPSPHDHDHDHLGARTPSRRPIPRPFPRRGQARRPCPPSRPRRRCPASVSSRRCLLSAAPSTRGMPRQRVAAASTAAAALEPSRSSTASARVPPWPSGGAGAWGCLDGGHGHGGAPRWSSGALWTVAATATVDMCVGPADL